MTEFIWVRNDDWEGLYINGKLVAENHTLSPYDFVNYFNIKLVNYDEKIENYLMKNGRFPDDFSELEALLNGN